MKWVIVLVVVAAVAQGQIGSVSGQDECTLPVPWAGQAHPAQCCGKLTNIFPTSIWTKAQACMNTFPWRNRGFGPPFSGVGFTMDPATKNLWTCKAECLFTENGLLTGDKKLDSAKVTAAFTASVAADMKPVVTAAISKCLSTYQGDIDTSLDCKSGAAEFKHCFGREVFFNCPSSGWTAIAECDALKAKLMKCPLIPARLGGPFGSFGRFGSFGYRRGGPIGGWGWGWG